MKRNYIYSISILFVFITIFAACSKDEVGPRLIVHVQEEDGTPAAGATVQAWHGGVQQSGSILNEDDFNQEKVTDGAGDVTFEFPNSAVLDVDIIEYIKETIDTVGVVSFDTLTGHKVVKLESVRQSSDDNNFNETVIVR